MGFELGTIVWPEVGHPIVVVPVGSCEQHGPHLPLDTDTRIAVALAHALAERRGDCVVAPPLTITASGEHQGFAGTLSIGAEVMRSVIVELVRSADWSAGVVLVNGHGGNLSSVEQAVELLEAEGRRPLAWWPRIEGADLHAGHTETSLMLAIDPEHVRSQLAVAGPTPSMADLAQHGVRAISASGVLGDPSLATADDGRRLLCGLADELAAAVAEWARS